MENTYCLNVGSKKTIVKGFNLQSVIENEGYHIISMVHMMRRNLNGKYIIRCAGNTTIYAEWVEKVNKLNANQ